MLLQLTDSNNINIDLFLYVKLSVTSWNLYEIETTPPMNILGSINLSSQLRINFQSSNTERGRTNVLKQANTKTILKNCNKGKLMHGSRLTYQDQYQLEMSEKSEYYCMTSFKMQGLIYRQLYKNPIKR